MSAQTHAQAAAALRQIAFGLRASQALYVAADLRIADHLAAKPMASAALARLTGADAGALHRLMRALCALGVFSESSTGEFALNATGELLRSDVPGSYRAAVLFLVGDVRWRCWSDLLGAVRAGGDGAERTLGMGLFDFYAAHPEESKLHDQAMRSLSAAQVAAVLEVMDLSHAGTVVDVGGGTGELLAAILARNPALRGILFDLPHVVAHAAQVTSAVADRLEIGSGSFFDSVPAGGDTYLLKAIIHDWDDARAMAILRNCRKAMKPAGKLLLLDRELPEPGQPLAASEMFLLDLEMLVMTPGGRERTRAEFARLLLDAGLELARTLPTRSPLTIFEARPV
jgi:SAM-dependent methyltransferase